MNKNIFLIVGFIILACAIFVEAKAASVVCDFVWPQRVIVDNITYRCGNQKPWCNNDKAQQGIAECCASAGPYQNCISAGLVEVNTDFHIDAWGYLGWGACEQQTGTREQLNAFCKAKEYASIDGNINVCYHERSTTGRWTWNGQIPMVKGNSTGQGFALTKVKCTNLVVCTENWSCGNWSSCLNGQQTRTCTDANSCGTTTKKPATTQSCTCQENWSCDNWSTCSNGQQTRTCTDANSCGTTASKPATSQACQVQCQENWSCGDWSTCVAGQQTKTCSDLNSCGTIASKPLTTRSCVCGENWNCGEWSGCINGQQTRTCIDLTNCGTTASRPATAQGCACQENWSCGNWSNCANNQQTRTCTDLNNCGTANLEPQTEKSCLAQACAEKWTCGAWGLCSNGQQARTCVDSNSCGTMADKPAIAQLCCSENWSCGNWSACSNGQQTRTCTDLNSCGSKVDKPSVTKSCVVAPPVVTPQAVTPQATPGAPLPSETPLLSEAVIQNKKVAIEKKPDNTFAIKTETLSVTSPLEITSLSSKVYAKKANGEEEVKVLPENIKTKSELENINKIEIKEKDDKVVYVFHEAKKGKLFFVIPISVTIEQTYDVENGSSISVKKPWWSFLVKMLEPEK